MADQTITVKVDQVAGLTNVQTKMVDMGDGTYAPLVASTSAPGVTTGSEAQPRSTYRLLSSGANVAAVNIKATAGTLFAISGENANAAKRYLKIYNKATAPSEADTPIRTEVLPAQSTFFFSWPKGYAMATGIGMRITTAAADADTGALTAGDILTLNLDYA